MCFVVFCLFLFFIWILDQCFSQLFVICTLWWFYLCWYLFDLISLPMLLYVWPCTLLFICGERVSVLENSKHNTGRTRQCECQWSSLAACCDLTHTCCGHVWDEIIRFQWFVLKALVLVAVTFHRTFSPPKRPTFSLPFGLFNMVSSVVTSIEVFPYLLFLFSWSSLQFLYVPITFFYVFYDGSVWVCDLWPMKVYLCISALSIVWLVEPLVGKCCSPL